MHSLIWNCMMSFGAGWFAVSASEAITVLGKNIQLPGLGSFMATAVGTGDYWAAFWAIVSMLAVILATDQLVWRPLLVWADKFKMELTESANPSTSWFYNLLRRAYIFEWTGGHVLLPLAGFSAALRGKLSLGVAVDRASPTKGSSSSWWALGIVVLLGLLFAGLVGVL